MQPHQPQHSDVDWSFVAMLATLFVAVAFILAHLA
jgi:hypothetical protein